MNTLLKNSITALNIPRLSIHLLLFIFSKSRKSILEDLTVLEPYGISSNSWGLLTSLVWDKSFRNLFYHRVGKVRYLISFLAPSLNGFIVNSHMPLGNGAHFVHCYTTLIHAESIGEHFKVLHNVTIGEDAKGRRPTILNNVEVYTGAIIFGNITIGNNVTIAAGAVVNKSLPDNCVVAGNPAVIVKRDGIVISKEERTIL